jgi:hypothetical protein
MDKIDWRGRVIIQKFAEGCLLREAAEAGGLTRQAVWWRIKTCPAFAEAVGAAKNAGANEAAYRAWLRHPFRGKRPPTGKGHGGVPRFRWGRR